jgi:hypothetical protein
MPLREENYISKRKKEDMDKFKHVVSIKRGGKTIKVDGDDKERLDYEMRRVLNDWNKKTFLT